MCWWRVPAWGQGLCWYGFISSGVTSQQSCQSGILPSGNEAQSYSRHANPSSGNTRQELCWYRVFSYGVLSRGATRAAGCSHVPPHRRRRRPIPHKSCSLPINLHKPSSPDCFSFYTTHSPPQRNGSFQSDGAEQGEHCQEASSKQGYYPGY